MNPARVKREAKQARYFAGLYRGAREDAIRETEKLLAALRGGSLRRVHFAAYDAHMATGLLYGMASHAAHARKRAAGARQGRRVGRGLDALGWPYAGDVYNDRRKRERGEA